LSLGHAADDSRALHYALALVSLEALAPDQRAVVQLVLQQERSYEELAGLLGISTDAVRERAHRGLDRIAPGASASDDERAQVADYLLAQQSVSKREATRSLLSSSPAAREWAEAVSDALREVARAPLPEIPAGAPAAAEPAPAAERPQRTEARPAPEPDGGDPAPAVRARPRPRASATDRPARPRPAAAGSSPSRGDGARKPSSKLGGALLIGGLAIFLVALVVFLVRSGDDSSGQKTSTGASATPTATATPSFQPVGQIDLTQVGGGKAKGQLVIFASADNSLAFTIQAEQMPESKRGEAYAVWLVGGKRPHRLGFAPAVGADGKFGTSGPRDADAKSFPNWLSEAKQVVVSRETNQDARQPGPIVLGGQVPSGQG
jgi:hypothetical protein